MTGHNENSFEGDLQSLRQENDKALMEHFRRETSIGDVKCLTKLLVDYSEQVLRVEPNEDLVKSYILSSLSIENLDLASGGFKFLQKKQPRDSELEGLVQFNRGFNSVAVSLFKNAGAISPKSKIAYSAALQKEGKLDLQSHYVLLNSLLEKVSVANTLLGTAHYNLKEYVQAEEVFRKAKEINVTERTLLDYLRVQNRLGVNIYGELNNFYVSTGSVLGREQLMTELNLNKISVPSFKVIGLGKMAVSLWSTK